MEQRPDDAIAHRHRRSERIAKSEVLNLLPSQALLWQPRRKIRWP